MLRTLALNEKNPYRDFPPVLGTLALDEKIPYGDFPPVLGTLALNEKIPIGISPPLCWGLWFWTKKPPIGIFSLYWGFSGAMALKKRLRK